MKYGKAIILSIIYFGLSTLITWVFVDRSSLYVSEQQKFLSASIAGGKWALQIFAALVWLKEKRWLFIKNIGLTCLIGSIILAPYCFNQYLHIDDEKLFVASLILSVLVMIAHYRFSVLRTGIAVRWFYGWLFCLAIAVTLQLTVVFGVLH